MKKTIVFIVFVFALVCMSSCRSTSKSCGLAEENFNNQETEKQIQHQHIEFVS